MRLDLDAIERRALEASPGPWVVWRDCITAPNALGGTDNIAQRVCGCGVGDAAFIAAARTDVPALVAEVRRLRAMLGGSCERT